MYTGKSALCRVLNSQADGYSRQRESVVIATLFLGFLVEVGQELFRVLIVAQKVPLDVWLAGRIHLFVDEVQYQLKFSVRARDDALAAPDHVNFVQARNLTLAFDVASVVLGERFLLSFGRFLGKELAPGLYCDVL